MGDIGEEEIELPELEDMVDLNLQANQRLSTWNDLVQIPANVCGWRANYKNPEKSEITRVQECFIIM
jgi:hypothetical protein